MTDKEKEIVQALRCTSTPAEWCQYVGKQIYFDLAAFGGAKTE